jgi:hypothetical protein
VDFIDDNNGSILTLPHNQASLKGLVFRPFPMKTDPYGYIEKSKGGMLRGYKFNKRGMGNFAVFFIKKYNHARYSFGEKSPRHSAKTVTVESSIQATRNLGLSVHNTHRHHWSFFRLCGQDTSQIRMVLIKAKSALNYYVSEGIVNY